MNLFDFMDAHVVLTWLLAWGVIPGACWLGAVFVAAAVELLGHILRFITITVRGWPPAHLDVHGNFRALPLGPKP